MAKKADETFQPSDFLKADQHEKDMSSLTKRIEVIVERTYRICRLAIYYML